jgi:DNA-binding NtrC family response regulator
MSTGGAIGNARAAPEAGARESGYAAAAAPAGGVEVKGKNWEQIVASVLAVVMQEVEGSRAEAVRQLGIDRKTLLKMLKEYGLEGVGLKGGEQRS